MPSSFWAVVLAYVLPAKLHEGPVIFAQTKESTSDDPGEGINYTVIANDKLDDTIFAERELQTVTDSLVLECPAGEVISGLFLKQVFPRGSRSAMITKWTPMAAIDPECCL